MVIDDEDYAASTTFQFEDDEPPEVRPPTGATGMLLRPVLTPQEVARVAALDAKAARSESDEVVHGASGAPAAPPSLIAASPPPRRPEVVDQAEIDTAVTFAADAAPGASRPAPAAVGAYVPAPVATGDDPAALVGQVFVGSFSVERSFERGATHVQYEATQLGRGRKVSLVVLDPRAHPCEGPAVEQLRARAQRMAAGGRARVAIERAGFPSGLDALWFSIDAPPALDPRATREILRELLSSDEGPAREGDAGAIGWLKKVFRRGT